MSSAAPGGTPSVVEPKKSVRLAEKRKLREEHGPSSNDDDFYFIGYHQFAKSGSPSRSRLPSSSSSSTPPAKKAKMKSSTESPTDSVSVSPSDSVSGSEANSARSTPTKGQFGGGKILKAVAVDSIVKSLNFEDSLLVAGPSAVAPGSGGGKKKSPKSVGGSSIADEVEEEEWLDALEAGKLDAVDDELRQIKNPKLLTARQRAMLEKRDGTGSGSPNIFEIAVEKSKSVLTQEMMRVKMEKTEKRRQQAQEKKEYDQKKTMDRLLKKKHTKPLKSLPKPRGQKQLDYKVSYISRADGNYVCFPNDYPLPLLPRQAPKPISVKICGALGCCNPKKYTCSKTGIPLCSLQCYKKNLSIR